MTSFVTGATGFVGSAVVKQLLDAGETVRVLVRPNSNRRNLEELPVEIFEGDLNDQRLLEKALHGCQALFHVAADYRLWALS
jgi:dihydroflavonol-4-reductase